MIEVIAMKSGTWSRRINIYGRDHSFGQVGFSVIKPVELQYYENPPAVEDEPFLSLDPQAAQQLIDSLWDCGLRPSEGSGSAGALAATQKHLEDMRKLVFEK